MVISYVLTFGVSKNVLGNKLGPKYPTFLKLPERHRKKEIYG